MPHMRISSEQKDEQRPGSLQEDPRNSRGGFERDDERRI